MSVEDFSEQTDGTVVATALDLATSAVTSIHGAYLVGCDGGRSGVRKAVGATLTGASVIQNVQSTYIRAPGLLARMGAPAWMTLALNPRRCGTVVAIDGRETWLIHNHLNKDGETFENVQSRPVNPAHPGRRRRVLLRHPQQRRLGGAPTGVRWLRRSRVFLCGDAAHLWMPYAGYGMNAGIADACNLAWLLSAVLEGWGDSRMLEAYEAERLPITDQVSRFAMDMALKVLGQRRAVPEAIEAPGPEGAAVRAQIGKAAYDLNVQQYCCGGLNFGYFYERSPIIHYDGADPPAYTMADFAPSTVPGCRAPHLWLADGRSLYDVLGPGYTLLRFDKLCETGALQIEAARQRVPLDVFDVEAPDTAPYDRKLVLVRLDQHVAWRGDALPQGLADFVATLRGAQGS